MTALVMIGDSNGLEASALSDGLRSAGMDAVTLADAGEFLSAVEDRLPDVVVAEAHLDVGEMVRNIRRRAPRSRLVLIADDPSIADVVCGIRNGADDFLARPVTPRDLMDHLRDHLNGGAKDDGVVCVAASSQACFELARRVAATDVSVMINGESGTGKEVVARYIHEHSPRATEPFVAINCAAIPEQMLEAILFGHDKGAFTGAHRAKAGKFEVADRGTLLLDEISEMALSLQAKLLRVLQEREVERVGSHTPKRVDVRVIATSNRDLSAAMKSGVFREDLYYRLSVFPLMLEPLRNRMEDIRPLASLFLRKHRALVGGRAMEFSAEALATLEQHDWPGNVRELENTVQRALVMTTGLQIQVGDVGLPAPREPSRSLAHEVQRKEFDLVLSTLRQEGGARQPTARALGISERTLRYKLNRMRQLGVLPE